MPTTQQIPIRQLAESVVGYDHDKNGVWYLRLRSGQRLNVNSRVIARFGGVDEILKLPPHYYAFVRVWEGEPWIYRVSTPDYVEVPSSEIVKAVREALGGLEALIEDFGAWRGTRVEEHEGAEYGEVTASVGTGEDARIGAFKFMVRVTWGNDGFTAIRIYSAIGIIKCVNGAIIGQWGSAAMYHTHAFAHEDPVKAVLERVKQAVRGAVEGAGRAPDVIAVLERTPADREQVMRLARRLGREFGRLWQIYVSQHGETALALWQVLSWFATHGGQSRRELAVREMTRLVQAQAPGPN